MASPAIEVVSWDVDGTLYELPAMVRAVVRAGARGLVRAPRRSLGELERLRRFRAAMARVRRRGGELAPGDLPADRDALVALEARWYGPAIARVGVRAGVGEALATFAARGLRQIAVSDYRAHYKLVALGLEHHFEAVYAGEDTGHLKPSPGIFAHVIEDLGIEPARMLHIGDRHDRDAAAAAAVGCRTLIVPAGADAAALLRRATAE